MSDIAAARERMYERARKSGFAPDEARIRSERAVAEAKARRERRRTEAELDIARGRLTSIFTSLPDLLWSLDAASGEQVRLLYQVHVDNSP